MKSLFVTMFFLFFYFTMFSQLSFGLKSGGALSKLDYEDTSGGESRSLFTYESNLFLGATIWKQFFVQLELDYLGKGGNIDIAPNAEKKLKIRTNQIEVPLLLGFKSSIKDWEVYGNIGAYFGRKTATDILETPITSNHKFFFDEKDKGYILGFGVMKKIGKINVLLETRYRYSRNRFGRLIFFSPSNSPIGGFDFSGNRGLSLLLGISYELSKNKHHEK